MKNVNSKYWQILFGIIAGLSSQPGLSETPFTEHSFTTDHTIHQLDVVPFLRAGEASIIARGDKENGARTFSVFDMDGPLGTALEPASQVTMPEGSLFFDYAAIEEKGRQNLLFFDDVGVLMYDAKSGSHRRLIFVESIYRNSVTPLFEKVDFARDYTGDGLADILVPDFKGYRLFINDGQSGFQDEIRLDMQVEMRLQSSGDLYEDFPPFMATPRYSQFPVFSMDVNFDGLLDIVFLRDHTLMAFLQKVGGGFATAARSYPVDVPMTGNSFAEQVKASERYSDQSNLSETTLSAFEDLNADGVPDMVTETDVAEGVFNRSTTYAFHYGRNAGGAISYNIDADASIFLDGFAAGARFVDVNGDGRKDFATGALKMGIGKIIGVLLSGSAGIHIHFFEQAEDGTFSAKADYRKKVSVDVNLSSGQSTIPVVEVADFNGNGYQDLLISDDQEEVRVFPATPQGKTIFQKKAIRQAIFLPKDDDMVMAEDVNGDGKADILIYYDRLGADGPNLMNTFKVLLAK